MTSPDPNRPNISAFLPCFNESGSINDTVNRLGRVLGKITSNYEIIVVDDGSTDDTAAITTALSLKDDHIKLVRHPHNLGYGRAVASGIAKACHEWIFFSDGDGQFDFNDLNKFLPFIGEYPVLVGYRRKRQEGFRRTATSKIYNLIVRLLFGLVLKDIDCSFKLFRSEIFKKITVNSIKFFVDTEIMTKAFYMNYNIKQIPVHHLPRKAGKSTIRLSHIFSTIGEMRHQWQDLKSLCHH